MSKKKKIIKKRYILRTILASLGAVILLVGGFAMKHYYRLEISNFESYNKEGHAYNIYPGTSIDEVLDMMEADYDIGSRQDVMLHARLLHFNYPEPGHYEFESQLANRELIERLKIGAQTPVHITWNNTIRTREQLAGQIASELMMDSVTLLEHLEDDEFLQPMGFNKETSRCLFIPNTYEVYWTITPEQLFARMQTEYKRFWTAERLEKARKINLSPVEVAILASIVEEESNLKRDQDTIASLYLNRLRKGMLLQADPTVKYANGLFGAQRVLTRHLKSENPYNTYVYPGLPPGVLKCPNAQTIDKVLNAPKTPYIFMCANPDFSGTHVFSVSHAEHQRVANEYHQKLNELKIK